MTKVQYAKKLRCRVHARYQGLRVPRVKCEECIAVFNYRRAAGIRGKR